MKARIQGGAQIDAIITSAPEQALQAEFEDLDAQLSPLVTTATPELVALLASAWTPPGSCW
jgi:hypothetical protein